MLWCFNLRYGCFIISRYGDQMNYSLNIGEWNSVFAVPSSIVDKYIKLAGANSLKLLLYLLRHGGKEYSADKLKSELGFTEIGELEDAALFWIQRGVIRYTNSEETALSAAPEEVSRVYETADPSPAPEKEYVQQTIDDIRPLKPAEKTVKTTPARVSSGEIASRMNNSDEVRMLFGEAEKIYGRPLRQRDNQTLIALVDHYGLPAGVALMLLSYCFKVGKTSPNYIESTAAGWSEDGIDSIDKADARIRTLEKNNDIEARIRKEFGIGNEFTPKQKTLLRVWVEDWSFSEEMIRLAVSITLENTGKLSMNYTNKILENWKRDNITTPEEAESPKAKPSQKKNDSSFDVDSIMSKIISSYNNN